MLHKVSNK